MAKKKAPAKKKKPAKKKAPAKATDTETPSSGKSVVHKTMKVNFWRTRMHKEELGVYQTMKYQAKTSFFSKNFDIEGIVEIDGKKEMVIAYNKDEWNEAANDKKKLVCRLFTIMEEGVGLGKGGNFKGGFELTIAHSLIQSFEIKHAAPVFIVQVPKIKYLTKLVKGWRLKGTRWTWPLLPEQKDDNLVMVKARGVIGPGKDYDIYIGKKKVAKVDGQKIQKQWEIEIYDETYAKDRLFVELLTMFGCICNFMKDVEKFIEDLYKPMIDNGTAPIVIQKRDLDLFKNPRMMRK